MFPSSPAAPSSERHTSLRRARPRPPGSAASASSAFHRPCRAAPFAGLAGVPARCRTASAEGSVVDQKRRSKMDAFRRVALPFLAAVAFGPLDLNLLGLTVHLN